MHIHRMIYELLDGNISFWQLYTYGPRAIKNERMINSDDENENEIKNDTMIHCEAGEKSREQQHQQS